MTDMHEDQHLFSQPLAILSFLTIFALSVLYWVNSSLSSQIYHHTSLQTWQVHLAARSFGEVALLVSYSFVSLSGEDSPIDMCHRRPGPLDDCLQ